MKLKQYIKQLEDLAKDNPEVLEYDVVYGIDDEGNDFRPVYYSPAVGEFQNGVGGIESFDTNSKNPNAVCVN